MPARADQDDPLWIAAKPPPDETPEQATLRRAKEAEAKRISDQIDESIRQESAQLKKKKIVRLLLLGASLLSTYSLCGSGPCASTANFHATPNRSIRVREINHPKAVSNPPLPQCLSERAALLEARHPAQPR